MPENILAQAPSHLSRMLIPQMIEIRKSCFVILAAMIPLLFLHTLIKEFLQDKPQFVYGCEKGKIYMRALLTRPQKPALALEKISAGVNNTNGNHETST